MAERFAQTQHSNSNKETTMSSNKKTTTKANSWWTFCWMTGESVGRFEGPWGSQRKAESEAKWCRRSSKLLACCATKHREVPSGMTASN